jgi:hypothetical protein
MSAGLGPSSFSRIYSGTFYDQPSAKRRRRVSPIVQHIPGIVRFMDLITVTSLLPDSARSQQGARTLKVLRVPCSLLTHQEPFSC